MKKWLNNIKELVVQKTWVYIVVTIVISLFPYLCRAILLYGSGREIAPFIDGYSLLLLGLSFAFLSIVTEIRKRFYKENNSNVFVLSMLAICVIIFVLFMDKSSDFTKEDTNYMSIIYIIDSIILLLFIYVQLKDALEETTYENSVKNTNPSETSKQNQKSLEKKMENLDF